MQRRNVSLSLAARETLIASSKALNHELQYTGGLVQHEYVLVVHPEVLRHNSVALQG